METIYKNDLVSLVWGYNGTRLDLLDSDGLYIDYFFYIQDLDNDENVDEKVQWVIDKIDGKSERKLCEQIFGWFDSVRDIEWGSGDEETIQRLREEFGDEYVCRIGNAVLLL